MLLAAIAVVVPTIQSARDGRHGRASSCRSNLLMLSTAMAEYVRQWDATPPLATWESALYPDYIDGPEHIKCPQDRTDHLWSYGMNPEFAGITAEAYGQPELADEPLFFDGRGSVVIERHSGCANYVYPTGITEVLAGPPAGLRVVEHD